MSYTYRVRESACVSERETQFLIPRDDCWDLGERRRRRRARGISTLEGQGMRVLDAVAGGVRPGGYTVRGICVKTTAKRPDLATNRNVQVGRNVVLGELLGRPRSLGLLRSCRS